MTIEIQDKTASSPSLKSSWSKDEEYQRTVKQPLEQSAELMKKAKELLSKLV